MSFSTSLYTWLYGNLVGSDVNKNRYYCNSKDFSKNQAKRWVIFNGDIEASKIPPHWHAWLHKTIDSPPIDYTHKYEWQKDHQQNMTGTKDAYYPDSHPLSKSFNSKKTDKKSEYETWIP